MFCANCGTQNTDTATFCSSCGQALGRPPVAGTPRAGAPGTCPHCSAAGQEGVFCRSCERYMPDPTGTTHRVTFNRRFFGDILLEGLLTIVTLIVGWYIWLFFVAKTSQTPAKRLLNVYIIDLTDGQTVAAGRVWVRDVVIKDLLVSVINIVTLVGFLGSLVDNGSPLFDKNRQALLHDKMVNTIVVYAPNGLSEALKRPPST